MQNLGESSLRTLAVVIPMYNEVVGAETCVRKVSAALARISRPAGFVVVDDGSTDGTGAVLARLAGEFPLLEIVSKPNGGYGSALIAGARRAAESSFEYVLFMDSDLTNPPEHIARFLPLIDAGYDLVKGSRFVPGGGMDGVPEKRARISRLGNRVASLLFGLGIADCTNGFRAIRTSAFLDMNLAERGFPIIVEELAEAKRLRLKVTEVPTSLYSRDDHQRPTSFQYNPGVFMRYLMHAIRARIV